MPGEKKKVNLVNLKQKFGLFLNKYYSCQNCNSIDRLAIGFNCEHKFCTNCNDNFTDQCKVCKTNIKKVHEDNLQNSLFPHFEDLKNIMSVDLNKIAYKLKQQQQPKDNEHIEKTTKEIDANKNEEDNKEDKQNEKEVSEKEGNEEPSENRTSKRQTKSIAKKFSGSSKNNSANQQKPTNDEEANQRKANRTRESRISNKKLADIFKGETILHLTILIKFINFILSFF